jgi:hypothetical protein
MKAPEMMEIHYSLYLRLSIYYGIMHGILLSYMEGNMPRKKKVFKKSLQQPQRVYDSALKGLMGDYAAEIIHELLPDTELTIEVNSEIHRESIRADLVYGVKRNGIPHTLNMELQSGTDTEMAQRMLRYHVELLLAYGKPVLSVLIYLFESTLPETPFREMSGDDALLIMKYQVIAVWKLNAQKYVQQGIIYNNECRRN